MENDEIEEREPLEVKGEENIIEMKSLNEKGNGLVKGKLIV